MEGSLSQVRPPHLGTFRRAEYKLPRVSLDDLTLAVFLKGSQGCGRKVNAAAALLGFQVFDPDLPLQILQCALHHHTPPSEVDVIPFQREQLTLICSMCIGVSLVSRNPPMEGLIRRRTSCS